MSGDPEKAYFSDGVTDEVITALSRFSELFVIASGSSFTYKDRQIDPKQIRRELGVQYLLVGSIRKSGRRVRLAYQLIDTANGLHLFAGRVDGLLADVFSLQDRITTSVVGAIMPRLSQAEIDKSLTRPTDRLDAYDYYLRGITRLSESTRKATDEALAFFSKSMELDPGYANAYARAAVCLELRIRNGWTADLGQDTDKAVLLARRAASLGCNDANALATSGFVLARIARDLDGGMHLIDRALALNSNAVRAWQFGAWVRLWLGDPEVAVEHATQAMRFSPVDPALYSMQTAMAFAYFYLRRLDEASSWASTAVRNRADFQPALRILAASHALAGRLNQAREAMTQHRHLNPGLSISKLKASGAPHRSDYFAYYVKGLRTAGLPE